MSETATDPVVDAEEEAEAAEALVAALIERIRAGEDISIEQVETQEKLARFARLRADAARRRAADAREAARLDACKALHDEVHAVQAETVRNLTADLKDFEEAAMRFASGVDAFNRQLTEWRARALELGVPAGRQGAPGSPLHANVGVSEYNGEFVAGDVRLSPVRLETALGHILGRIQVSTQRQLQAISVGSDRAYELLARELGVPSDPAA